MTDVQERGDGVELRETLRKLRSAVVRGYESHDIAVGTSRLSKVSRRQLRRIPW
jgi:hypothetical protein